MTIQEWREKYNIDGEAFSELRRLLTTLDKGDIAAAPDNKVHDENYAKTLVQLEASHKGWILMRNNVGAGKLDNNRFIRWGLANESRNMNRQIKSSDLIGIKPDGQFVARECKRPGWAYRNTEAEQAQLAFIKLINRLGGDAKFTTGSLE